jgi:hypothetical protein
LQFNEGFSIGNKVGKEVEKGKRKKYVSKAW